MYRVWTWRGNRPEKIFNFLKWGLRCKWYNWLEKCKQIGVNKYMNTKNKVLKDTVSIFCHISPVSTYILRNLYSQEIIDQVKPKVLLSAVVCVSTVPWSYSKCRLCSQADRKGVQQSDLQWLLWSMRFLSCLSFLKSYVSTCILYLSPSGCWLIFR